MLLRYWMRFLVKVFRLDPVFFFLFWYFIFKLRVKIWKEIVSEFESRFLTIFKLVRITIIIITQQQLDALSNSMTDEFTSKSFVRKKRAEKEESLK